MEVDAPSNNPEAHATAKDGAEDAQRNRNSYNQGAAQHQSSVHYRAQLLASADANPIAHQQGIDKLTAFVEGSLDKYRPELRRVLYLVVVHSFLMLVQVDEAKAAHDLLSKHALAFKQLHASEIDSLKSVSSSFDIDRSELARAFVQYRTPVVISKASLDLLLRFLQRSDNTIVLSIINDKLYVKTRDGEPDAVEEQPDDPSDPSARLGVPVQPLPHAQRAYRWGEHPSAGASESDVPMEGSTTSSGAAAAAAAAVATNTKTNTSDTASDANTPTLGILSALPERKVDGSCEAEFDAVQPNLPLPNRSDTVDAAAIEDASNQARISASEGALPSVCFFTLTHSTGSLSCADASTNASYVAAGFDDSTVKLWDVENAPSATREPTKNEHPMQHTKLCGHSGPVYGVSFSPDQELLLSGAFDGSVRLWHCKEKLALAAYNGHRNPVWDVAFSPIGHYFASASHDRTARVFTTDCEYARRICAGHTADVDCISWHPSCNYIATGSCDRTARFWDVHSGEAVRLFAGQLSMLTCVACSPDGKEVAAGAEDGTVSVWDINSAKRRLHLKKHAGAVWSIAYARDGNVLASASEDCSVKLWDVSNGSLQQQQQTVHAAASSSNAPNARGALKSLPTKAAGVTAITFTRRNLCIAMGPR